MPGLDWDLNLDLDQQALARRLSFSDADSAEPLRASRSFQMLSVPPPIKEDASEGQQVETPVRAAPPSVPVTSSATLYPAQVEMPHPTSAPVATSVVLAPPAPLQSQQLQGAVAAATTSEYQRQLQAAMQQQALAAAMRARAWVRQLRLYTVARASRRVRVGRAASFVPEASPPHRGKTGGVQGSESAVGSV